jgi:hypothetical protein
VSRLEQLDRLVERGADRLQELAEEAAASEGLLKQLAEPLAEDAAFLRRLKPSLIVARIRGELPKNNPPAAPDPVAPAGPQLGKRPNPKKKKKKGGGPNPFVVLGAAFALGIVLAKLLDWRGHAHPHD